MSQMLGQQANFSGQDAGQILTMPKRGLEGIAVGLEQFLSHPTDPSNALQRASAATQPDYIPQKGEKFGSFAGGMMDPVSMGLAAAGGTPFEAASMAGALGGAAAAGSGGSILDQLSSSGRVDPKATLSDTAKAMAIAGILQAPQSRLARRVGGALSTVPPDEYGQIVKNPKIMLPEFLGGAESPKTAGQTYRAGVERAGVNPDALDLPKEYPKSVRIRHVIEVENDLDRMKSGIRVPMGMDKKTGDIKYGTPTVSTEDLIKANREARKVIEGIPEQETSLRRQWIETKNKIKTEIANRNDGLAQTFKKYAMSKTKETLSSAVPKSGYMLRRTMFHPLNPVNLAISPRVLSSIITGSALIPTPIKGTIANSAVELLRRKRDQQAEEDQ